MPWPLSFRTTLRKEALPAPAIARPHGRPSAPVPLEAGLVLNAKPGRELGARQDNRGRTSPARQGSSPAMKPERAFADGQGRLFGRRAFVLSRRRSLVGRAPSSGTVSSSIGGSSSSSAAGRPSARAAGVLVAFIGVHQIVERRVAFSIGVADLVLVHLGQHLDVFLRRLVLVELAGDAFAKGLGRDLAVLEARLVGDVLIGEQAATKSAGVGLARCGRGRPCLNLACARQQKGEGA